MVCSCVWSRVTTQFISSSVSVINTNSVPTFSVSSIKAIPRQGAQENIPIFLHRIPIQETASLNIFSTITLFSTFYLPRYQCQKLLFSQFLFHTHFNISISEIQYVSFFFNGNGESIATMSAATIVLFIVKVDHLRSTDNFCKHWFINKTIQSYLR
jgi:hypothetical protein